MGSSSRHQAKSSARTVARYSSVPIIALVALTSGACSIGYFPPYRDVPPADAADIVGDTARDIVDTFDAGEVRDVVDVPADCGACPCPMVTCGGTCVDLSTDARNCGVCGTACGTVANGRNDCISGSCSITCATGYQLTGGACVLAAPRLIAPLSTSTVTSQRPTLRWELPAGTTNATVEICRDRTCTTVTATMSVATTSYRPVSPLAAGTYYWRVRTSASSVSATWQFRVGFGDSMVDGASGSIPDFNGDGRGDVVVGAPYYPDSQTPPIPGHVWAYYHNAPSDGPETPREFTPPTGDGVAAKFGTTVASAGDVNGDGFADLFVGAPDTAVAGMESTGVGYVYFGSASGLAASPSITLMAPAPRRGMGFANVAATADDVDHDGYADIVVGGWGSQQVFVFRGGPFAMSWFDTVTHSDGNAGTGPCGDVNGDGFPDVIAFFNNSSGATAPSTLVFYGSASGYPVTPSVRLVDPSRTSGRASCGDFNGDGYTDVVTSNNGNPSVNGSWRFYAGGPSGLSTTASATFTSMRPSGEVFSANSVALGDVDGDGTTDLAIDAASWTAARPSRVYVFLGTSAGPSTTPIIVEPGDNQPNFGYGLGTVGDVDGDERSDLAVGAPEIGAAFVIYAGTAGSLFSGPRRDAVPAASLLHAGYGYSLAFCDSTVESRWLIATRPRIRTRT